MLAHLPTLTELEELERRRQAGPLLVAVAEAVQAAVDQHVPIYGHVAQHVGHRSPKQLIRRAKEAGLLDDCDVRLTFPTHPRRPQ